MRFLPIETVIDEVIDWTDYKGVLDRVAMKKWANTVLRKLEVPQLHDEVVTLLKVENYTVNAPDNCHKIVQIAFRNQSKQKVRRVEVVEWTQKLYDGSGCELIITKDCPKCHNAQTSCTCDSPEVIYNVDRLWELSHPELKYNHMKWYYRHGGLTNENQIVSPINPEFVLMKPATHDFFNADSFVPGCLNLNSKLLVNNKYTYKFSNNKFTINQEKGQILLAYTAVKTDKNGYRLVPDVEEVYEAIKWYIIEALNYRMIGKSATQADRNHYRAMTADARNEKVRAMGAAFEVLDEPDFKNWWDFLEQNYFKMIKDRNQVDYFDVKTPDQYAITMNRLTKHD